VHAVALCPPLYCPGATRPRQACSRLTSRFRVASYCRRVDLWTWCATSTASAAAASTVRYARRPRRTLYLHDCQRASRKLSVHAVALCALCPPLYCPGATRPRQACSQSSYLTLSGCQLLSQGGPGVRLARHQHRRQALRRQRCTARRIGGCDKRACDKHCEYNDAQPDRFSHGRRDRDVRYARTIINAHYES
jgi:hypothetical protein